MTVKVNFTQTPTLSTTWLSLKWTYLVVSSTFDGTYSNIWCTSASTTGPFPLSNVPLDHIGSAFVMQGGVTGDCDIYVHSLFQADLQNCEPVPASGQYKGGKIIVHAYITGFFSHLSAPTIKMYAFKHNSGPSSNTKSDS